MKYVCIMLVVVLSCVSSQAAVGLDAEVSLFLRELVTAYNSRDFTMLESLVGDSSQMWIVEESKRNRDVIKLEMTSLSVQSETNATVAVNTSSITGNRVAAIEMVFKLGRQGKAIKLLGSQTPSVEKQNKAFREARNTAALFVDAINNSDTNHVLRLLCAEEDKIDLNSFRIDCRKLGLEWVVDAMEKDVKLSLSGVSRHREKVVVRFGVHELGNSKSAPRKDRLVSAFFLNGKFSGETRSLGRTDDAKQ